MKGILTVGIALSLLITSATAQIPAIKLEKAIALDPEQQKKNIEICTQNLIKLGKSIQTYIEENGDYPEWLSDLHHPKYLPYPDVLICPSDRLGGKAVYPRNVDPKMPVSYGYQYHPEYRERKSEKLLMYGDVIPLVRCRHHPNPDFHCLNLSVSYKVTRSFSLWEAVPEQLYETSEHAIAALETGLQRQPDNENLSYYVYPSLARLYIKVGQEEKIDGLVNLLKSTMNPDSVRDNITLGMMLVMMDQNEEALQILKKLEGKNPDDRSVLQNLAMIHQKLGNDELAKEYQQKAEPVQVQVQVQVEEPEPGLALIGKAVPDFSATDLEGKPISLADYRGKVVLLHFWAVWFGPCIVEMPNVKRVYNTYKDEGFDIIGISLDTDEKRLRDYLKENEIPWRQVFNGNGWRNPIALEHGIRTMPTAWLIDRDGTLISNKAIGDTLEQLVGEAMKDKPVD